MHALRTSAAVADRWTQALAARSPLARSSALMLSESDDLCRAPRNPLEALDAEQRRRVLAHALVRPLFRGARVFSQGEAHHGIFLIESGRVRVSYTSPSGREITLAYWGAGHFVGGPDLFGGVHAWSGDVTLSGSALFLEGATLRRLARDMPDLALSLIDSLTFKGRCYSTMAQMLGTRSVTERLCHVLLHLCRDYGVRQPDGVLIGDSFTHVELANLVGSTRQWVTTSLKRLQRQGVLSCGNGAILVHRPDLLAQMRESAGAS